eukprot:12454481-Prorocentrum_lima.AAC.1
MLLKVKKARTTKRILNFQKQPEVEWDEVDCCVMHPEVETQFNSSSIPKLDDPEDEWEWRG